MTMLSLNGFNGSPWLTGTQDLGGWIDAAAAAGFPLFAPDCPSIGAWLEAGQSLSALAQRFRDAQVGCAVVTVCGMLDDGPQQDSDFAFARKAAEALDARFLQINASAPDAATQRAALERGCAMLNGTGLKFAIEYMPTTPLATLAATVELIDSVGRDKAGALVDIWHHSHDPDGWQALATAPLDAIAYVEFCDALSPHSVDLQMEMLQRRAMPGEGVLDCTRFASLLRDRGYDGMVSIEVLSEEWRSRPLNDFATACAMAGERYFQSAI